MDIKPMLTNNCTLSGCHAQGTPFPEFETYSGFKTFVDNGAVEFWVLNTDLMPPYYAADSTVLNSSEELKLKSWINAGALNN